MKNKLLSAVRDKNASHDFREKNFARRLYSFSHRGVLESVQATTKNERIESTYVHIHIGMLVGTPM
jgi:hypothetical protein